MHTVKDLEIIAIQKLYDAKALYRAKRYDGSLYICGYAIEIALKAIVCKEAGLSLYPETQYEYKNHPNKKTYKKYWIHKLNELLPASGKESIIKPSYKAEWDFVVSKWGPDSRYVAPAKHPDKRTELMLKRTRHNDALNMIGSVTTLLKVLGLL